MSLFINSVGHSLLAQIIQYQFINYKTEGFHFGDVNNIESICAQMICILNITS